MWIYLIGCFVCLVLVLFITYYDLYKRGADIDLRYLLVHIIGVLASWVGVIFIIAIFEEEFKFSKMVLIRSPLRDKDRQK